jgi:endonuclease G
MRSFFRFFLFLILALLIIWVCYHFLSTKSKAKQQEGGKENIEFNVSNETSSAFKDSISFLSNETPNGLPEDYLLPSCGLKGQLVKHEAYELYYVNEAEEAAWVAYNLTEEHLNGPNHRSNNFEPDPLVKLGSAEAADYTHSGYDRGHLAPAADFSWSSTAMQESFYYSNMTPQDPSFNRGKWKELEEQVREWAAEYHYVTVITGPIFNNVKERIGPDHVVVPQQFYKVILTKENGVPKAIGFLMENHALHSNLVNYATSIDKIEQISGLNFFEGLNDSIENKLEASVNIQQWDFVKKEQARASNNYSKTSNEAVICKGITKAGKPCKNHTKNPNGYCQQHQSQAQ